jgi:hypothetical protein
MEYTLPLFIIRGSFDRFQERSEYSDIVGGRLDVLVGILIDCCQTFLSKDVKMHHVCQRIIPRMLT